MGPITQSNKGNKYILVICGYFTKWTSVPLENQEASTIGYHFVTQFVCTFGVPNIIHSDQGTNFESKLFKDICDLLGSEKKRTTAFRSQCRITSCRKGEQDITEYVS